jgi:amidase
VKSKRDADAIFVERFVLGGDGPAVAVKDTIDVAGFPTRAGSRSRSDVAPAERHADVVAALLAAGCRIIGKTNLHEFAYGVTGINDWTGTPRNARFPDRVPGGSSSGSAAAVAAGLVEFAIGTDTGGSIRVPAACCGVVGFKPTYGLVSRAGVMPTFSSLDCVGPFALSVAGIERAMSILSSSFAPAAATAGVTLGIVAVESEPEVEAAFERGLQHWGSRRAVVALPGMQAAYEAGLAVIGAETYAAVCAYATADGVGADVRDRLLAARDIPPGDLVAAERVRRTFTDEVDAALERADVLVLPTMPVPTLTLAAGRDGRAAIRMTAFVRPFNLSGHPAMSLPLPAGGGYAAGLQLVGRRGGDAELCAIARDIEAIISAETPG